jgi:hypothetical protein
MWGRGAENSRSGPYFFSNSNVVYSDRRSEKLKKKVSDCFETPAAGFLEPY